jgi:hypothetical protein
LTSGSDRRIAARHVAWNAACVAVRRSEAVRLLVLDRSGILPWLVTHAAPPGVEVVAVTSLGDAERCVRERRIDGVVVSMPHSQLPWASFQHLCASQRPPVPVLYTSCEHHDAVEAGLDPGAGVALFLPQPLAHERLHDALAGLLGNRLPAA